LVPFRMFSAVFACSMFPYCSRDCPPEFPSPTARR
jgi:hypothetical protein